MDASENIQGTVEHHIFGIFIGALATNGDMDGAHGKRRHDFLWVFKSLETS